MDLQLIPLALLDEPQTPNRTHFDTQELADLAASIKTIGLIEPLIAEKTAGDRYQVRAGHRRLLACRLANCDPVPCVIRSGDAKTMSAVTFAENAHRADLTPWEEALAVARAAEDHGGNYTQLGKLFSRSAAWIASRLALFDYPDDLKLFVQKQQLTLAHAAKLARITDQDHRIYLAQYAMLSGANANTIEAWVQAWEVEAAAGEGGPVPRPYMTNQVQQPVVLLDCEACGTKTDSRDLKFVRLCVSCDAALHS